VYSRVEDLNTFYNTTDLNFAQDFLKKYDAQYIIVGQLERAKYQPEGIAKFEDADGVLWTEIYRNQETTIYQTLNTFQ
jgi:uncharacterized membrane protein